ncbi:MAG: hypothetical protein ONB24_15085, partial [candidate division KSB1 bacterium]|nr:hypothetical protein [candidate division KSB1 bacterium]
LWLDVNHFVLSVVIVLTGLFAVAYRIRHSMTKQRPHAALSAWTNLLLIFLLTVMVCGILMIVKIPTLERVTRWAYSMFDLSLLIILLGALFTFYPPILQRAVRRHRSYKSL